MSVGRADGQRVGGVQWRGALLAVCVVASVFGLATARAEAAPAQPVTAREQTAPVVAPVDEHTAWGTFTQVSAASYHTCGVRTDATVSCWGSNHFGQALPPAGHFTQVSAGLDDTCGVRTDGTVSCWGDDDYGEAAPPSGTFTQVSVGGPSTWWGGAGGAHTCGVRTDATVACWGDDRFGEATPPSGGFTQVSAGTYHTCGVRNDGTVSCWGNDFVGQAAPPGGTFTQVSAGLDHTCGVRTDATVSCWGNDFVGQAAPPGGTFTQVSAGHGHTCGVRNDGTVSCWGNDFVGQAAPPGGTFTQVSAGAFYTCGVRTDASVYCWGNSYDDYGQAIPPSRTFTQVSAGTGHTCGVRTDATVACWGNNPGGHTAAPSGTFLQVSAGHYYSPATDQGGHHTCGVRTDATVACWGNNDEGEATPPSGSFTQVSAGLNYTCGVRTDGTVSCWGINFGQALPPAGRFTQVSASRNFTCGVRTDATVACWGFTVGEPSGTFTQVSAGELHACGLRTDATVACWGYEGNSGRPTGPAPSGTFTQVSAGSYHTCGVRTDATLACWSAGDYSLQATPPSGTFTQVSAGMTSTCGIRTNGVFQCWGGRAALDANGGGGPGGECRNDARNVPPGLDCDSAWWTWPDSDDDGLPDHWERQGVWSHGRLLDLRAAGARVGRLDAFVYVDVVEGERWNGRIEAMLAQAFRRAPLGGSGIALHVISAGGRLRRDQVPSPVDNSPTFFRAVTAQAPSGREAFASSPWSRSDTTPALAKYVCVCPDHADGSAVAGDSMTPRINDFAVVTVNEGRLREELEERRIVTGLSDSLRELVYDRFNAITTMHELGHLYGLNHHGVSETPPSSTSYRSIMSNTYALFGVPQTSGPTTVFVIDYSREWTVNLDWRISQARNTLGALTLINGQNGEHPDFYDQTHPSLAAPAETAETNDPEPKINDLLDDPEIAAQAVDFFDWVEGLDCEGADVATCHPGTAIAGTVTDDTTAEPVGQVCVMAENQDTGASFDGSTAPDGTYTVDGLAAGDYVVRFVDCSGAGYLSEFFDDTNDRALATPVHVDEGVTVDGVDAALALGGTLSGTVTADDTGEPLENVCVEAHGLDIDEGWVVSSGPDGTYEIHGMPAGSFAVRFYDCGGNGYLAEYFDDVTAQDAATAVSVTAGETTAGIDAGLALGGTITGTVTDDTTGDPVEGICVAGYVADGDGDNGIGWDDVDHTAADGTYTLDGLTGDYRVQFADCLDRGYDGEYFDDTTVSADATRVTVTAPDTTGGIDAALTPAGSDGGDVTAPTVEVSAPADGAVYVQGAAVTAHYSCHDEPGGSGLAWCSAATPSGSPLDTSEAGTHEFTVNAADNAGNTTQVTHTYTVTTVSPDAQTNTLRIKKRTTGGVPDGATFAIRVRCFAPDGDRHEQTLELHRGQAMEIDVPADHPRCAVHETDNGDATATTYDATSTTAVAVNRPRSGRVQFGDAGGQRARVIVTNRFPAP